HVRRVRSIVVLVEPLLEFLVFGKLAADGFHRGQRGISGQRQNERAAFTHNRAEEPHRRQTRAFRRGQEDAAQVLRRAVRLRSGSHIEVVQMKVPVRRRGGGGRRARDPSGGCGGGHKVSSLH